MELLLWRHAEAHEPTDAQTDLKRPLTSRGEKQARLVGRWLRAHQPQHLEILVSPALRCQQTAAVLGLPFKTDPRIAPSADVADILSAADWPTGHGRKNQATLLIGHQPTLGRLAALLLAGQEADWSIKKGALWWFSNRTREDEPQVILRTVINPGLI